MTECMNCCNPIRATQPSVKCGSCYKNIHAECLNLPQNIIFAIIELKSASIKIQCTKCSSGDAKIEELKNMITELKEDLTARVRALEEAVDKIESEKNKVEIKTERDGETATASSQGDNQVYIKQEKNSSDSSYTTIGNVFLTQEQISNETNIKQEPNTSVVREDSEISDEKSDSGQADGDKTSRRSLSEVEGWVEDNAMHISKKYKKSEVVRRDPIRVRSLHELTSGLCSQDNNEMELSDKNQEYQERTINFQYLQYQSDYESNKICVTKLKKKHISILPKRYSEVCYVSEDFYFLNPMTAKFDISYSIGGLLNNHKKEGSCVVLKSVPHYMFCLIFKKLPTSPCQRDVVFRSLWLLRQQALMLQIKTLVFPIMENTTGDSSNWWEVPFMIEFLFKPVPIQVFLVSYDKEKYIEYLKKTNEVKLRHVKHPLFQMKGNSFIIYWASEDGCITQEMRGLDKKFDFLRYFEKSAKKLGEIVRYKSRYRPNQTYVLCGCVIRRTPESAIDFAALQKCVVSINDYNESESFRLAAAAAVEDEDEATNYKIVNVFMNCLRHVRIHFCWIGNLKHKMPSRQALR